MVKPNHPVPRQEQPKLPTLYDAMSLARSHGYDFDDDPDPYGYGAELEQSYGLNLLDTRWEAHPDDDRWVEKFKARGRKAIVAMLSLKGYSETQIAKRIGVSEVVVRRDLGYISREWKERYLELAEDMAVKDIARLDYYLTRLIPGIDSGDPQAIRTAIEIVKRRGDIMGYSSGVQMDVELMLRQVAESQGLDPDRAAEVGARISVHLKA